MALTKLEAIKLKRSEQTNSFADTALLTKTSETGETVIKVRRSRIELQTGAQ
jgi:hypothetical protein